MVIIRESISGGALTETTYLVLLAVFEPRHGYSIMQFIEEQTGGRVQLGAGTLYGALHTLEKKEWIMPAGTSQGTKKRAYLITDLGKQIAADEQLRLKQMIRLGNRIVKEAERQ